MAGNMKSALATEYTQNPDMIRNALIAGLWPSKLGRTWFFHSNFFLSAVVHIYIIKLCIGRLTVNGGDIIVTHNVHTDGFPAVN